MVKITVVRDDCGNAPKKEIIKQLNIAFARSDVETLSEMVTDDIVWEIKGDKTIEGKEAFVDELNGMKDAPVTEYIIDRVLTHGIEGAASGEIIMEDGKRYAYSDFYYFNRAKSSKIKSITSYLVEV